ncbi:MAG: hypothetical protein OXP69_24550 [Spirochaetaceae bacterium]|nr:hypothetical protein [Spirochaetaceae bacterium]
MNDVNAPNTTPAPATATTAEPLADRLWRQVEHGIDRDRLLPSVEKRRRQLLKQLDKPLNQNGWARLVGGQAHAIVNGKAQSQRNAERTLIETMARWLADVSELAPERLPALREIVAYGLRHPEPLAKAGR